MERIERPLTLVAQVEQALREAVANRVYPDDRLPSEIELAEQLGVSRETVRRAADKLEQEGLLVKHRRRGTFIKSQSKSMELKAPPSTVLGYLQADYGASDTHSEVVTRATSSFMFDGALTEAGRAGFQLLVRSAAPAKIREAFEQLHSPRKLRGIIFASVAEEKLLRRLGGLGLPTVLLDHDLHLPQIHSVRGDSFQCANSAVQHLAVLGHRRIACAYWQQDELNRWFPQGYRQGMKEAGVRCKRHWQIPAELTREGADRVVSELLTMSPRPTALLCFHNTLAHYVIDALENRGLKVPQDLSVFGGGGEEVIGLTCNQLDWYELGRLAMRTLLDTIEAQEELRPAHHVVAYTFRPGKTTAALASQ